MNGGVASMQGKIGATTACYAGFSLDDALSGIAAAGYKFVELSAMYEPCDVHSDLTEHVVPERMTDQDVELLKSKLDSYRLRPMSISGHADLMTKDGIEGLKRRIALAKEIGAEVVNTKVGNPSSEKEVDSLCNNIIEVADFASQSGIIVGLETSGNYFSTAQKLVPLLKRVGSPFIRLNYDTANVIYYAGVRPEEDIEYGVEFLAHLHLKDKIGGKGVYHFPPLGRGEVDFRRIFTVLRRSRFEGPLSVEIEFDGKRRETLSDVNEAVRESLEYLKDILRELG
jgi:sugar phosphate isomerase/epimerase